MGKLKKKLKKIYHLYQKEGAVRAAKITGAKCIYNLREKPQIDKWRQSRPAVVKNRLVFYSNVDYTDNARALSDYLVEQGYLKDHEIIWLVSDPEKFKKYEQPNLRFIREKYKFAGFRTPEAFQYVWTAEKVFFTHSMRWVKDEERMEEQKFINLWHGCGYKSAKGKSENIHFDFLLVPGKVFVDTKAAFFQCDLAKVLPIGYPRYDTFLSKKEKAKAYIDTFRNAGGCEAKVVFWMPTYRLSNNRVLSENTLNSELNLPVILNYSDLEELNVECSRKNVVIILKKHHLQSEYSISQKSLSHIKYMEDADLEMADVQLYEALSWVDALITDYSSVAIDFLLMDAPMAFTLDDYEQYRDSRGFVFEDPLQYMPGMHVYDKKQFYDFIGMVSRGEDSYAKDREKVIEVTHNRPENGYCRRIAEYFHI